MMILSTFTSFEAFSRSIVAHELTFYLAAVVLVVLTAESCIKLLNRDSFGITVGVYLMVFAWYFVDPFINPEQYDYLPSSSLGQSYGQVVLFLIGFRVFAPVAIRWILGRRSSGVFDTRLTPEQILIATAALWLLLFVIGIARMGDDVGAWCSGEFGERISDLLRKLCVYCRNSVSRRPGIFPAQYCLAVARSRNVCHYAPVFLFRGSTYPFSCGGDA